MPAGLNLQGKMRKVKNITQQKFGYLIALHDAGYRSKHNHVVWTFLCDCGKIKDIEHGSVVSGRTKSCGCKQKEMQNIHKLKSKPDSSLRSLFGEYIKNANKRSLTFEISLEQFLYITSCDCHYCGCPPEQVYCRKNRQTVIPYIYNGIDRVDNSVGYEMDNIVPCCGICNIMKRTLGYEEFMERIQTIYNHRILQCLPQD